MEWGADCSKPLCGPEVNLRVHLPPLLPSSHATNQLLLVTLAEGILQWRADTSRKVLVGGTELQVGRHPHFLEPYPVVTVPYLVVPLMKRGGWDIVDTLQVSKVDVHILLYLQ